MAVETVHMCMLVDTC